MKIIKEIIKKMIFALLVLYGFNIIMNALNLFIPINVYTIGTLILLGFPGLCLLVGILLIL